MVALIILRKSGTIGVFRREKLRFFWISPNGYHFEIFETAKNVIILEWKIIGTDLTIDLTFSKPKNRQTDKHTKERQKRQRVVCD